jgi:hypothetical protein
MQHVDRPAHVQPLPQPPGKSRARVKANPLRGVLRPQRSDCIGGHDSRQWHVRQCLAVRPSEVEDPVGPTLELVALLVHRAVMAATE